MEVDIEENNKGKKLKVSSEFVLQIVQHPTSNIIVTSGKALGTEKHIMEHYRYLNF